MNKDCPKKTLDSALADSALSKNVTINLDKGTYNTSNIYKYTGSLIINGTTEKIATATLVSSTLLDNHKYSYNITIEPVKIYTDYILIELINLLKHNTSVSIN